MHRAIKGQDLAESAGLRLVGGQADRARDTGAYQGLRASGWRVAIVTNGTADNQLGKIQRTGLAEEVDAYALSGVEGVRKPDTGLFEIAAERCGVTLVDGGWMIGDHLVADIGGGRAAGLRTIWIDRGTWPGHEHDADHVVTDVLQAMEILHAER